MSALEEVIVTAIHETWYRTKEELKVEVLSHYATKQDLNQVRLELLGKLDVLYEKTEKDKAELLGIMKQDKQELLGIMKQDKAELLGIINQTKEELLRIMKQNKQELLGKLDALYAKTEKDKAELLGIINHTKAQLLGKFDALYEKTEKDKAELLIKIEKIDKKFSMYFAVLLFAIIFLNQNALEFIAKVLGLLR